MMNNNKVKGDLYEVFIAEKIKKQNNEVKSLGIDILVKENGKYEFIQCKNWNKKLGFCDISTFLGMCFLYNSNGKLYYTLNDDKI